MRPDWPHFKQHWGQLLASANTSTPLEPALFKARVATSVIFALNGFMIGNWAVRIPTVSQNLHLSKATLGLVLLAVAVGSLVSMPIVGRFCARLGSKRVTTLLSLCFPLSVALPALAGQVSTLVAALFLLGAANGGLDVAMNTQGTTVERRAGRPILSSFHALWSVGSLLGAALGGVFARFAVPPSLHLLIIAGASLLGCLAVSRMLLPGDAHAEHEAPSRLQLNTGLLALGGIAFCALMGEGAIGDWSALYLQDSLRADAGLAASGLAVFQLSMAALRFVGDSLRARLGDARVVLLSGLVASSGLAFGLIVQQLWAVLIGFAMVGMGVAVIFPAALGLVAQLEHRSSGPAIAWVSSVGYAGFLVGPPLIGLLAEATSLRFGLAVVAVAGALIAALSRFVRTPGAAQP